MKFHIAIVEDDDSCAETLAEYVRRYAAETGEEFDVTRFKDGDGIVENYAAVYDVIFLDIQMKIMDGMETAKYIRKLDKAVIIVFVTNMAQYAIKGYEVDALDFILKPVDKYSFALKMERALARISQNKENSLLINTDTLESIVIQIPAIQYVEVNGHYVIYHTRDGVYKQYSTLKKVEETLNNPNFVKCNRCFLVNLSYIESISKEEVIVAKERLIISRPQKKAFLNAFSDYIGGRNNV
jgi:DNA-binding LytR/AlgR family response regulator